MFKLVNENGMPLFPGDQATTFRGEAVTIVALHPPHKPSSTGKVTCADSEGRESTWYASVIDARYIEARAMATINGQFIWWHVVDGVALAVPDRPAATPQGASPASSSTASKK
jgi:hypothetical protein